MSPRTRPATPEEAQQIADTRQAEQEMRRMQSRTRAAMHRTRQRQKRSQAALHRRGDRHQAQDQGRAAHPAAGSRNRRGARQPPARPPGRDRGLQDSRRRLQLHPRAARRMGRRLAPAPRMAAGPPARRRQQQHVTAIAAMLSAPGPPAPPRAPRRAPRHRPGDATGGHARLTPRTRTPAPHPRDATRKPGTPGGRADSLTGHGHDPPPGAGALVHM